MTEDEARRIAKVSATEVLHELFLRLGVDVDEPTQVQRDMAFVRNWRLSAEAIKRQGLMAAVGVLIVGILGLIWASLKGTP